MNCPFCNITEDRTKIIKKGKNVFVILSDPRLTEGHLLIIPKRHVEKLSELNKKEKEKLLNTAIEFQEKILLKISTGCDIRCNYRPFQKENGLKVNHLHIHLQPREFEDKLYKKSQIFEKKIFKQLTNKEISKISKLLKKTSPISP